jgi:hypothetical protein
LFFYIEKGEAIHKQCPELLKSEWHRFDEIYCNAAQLVGIPEFVYNFKKFDKFGVNHISTDGK